MTDRTNARHPTFATMPPESLYRRIRASVSGTPAPTLSTGTKIVIALPVTLLLVAIVVLVASEIVYGRPAVGLDVDAQAVPLLVSAASLIVTVTLAATAVALSRGRSGLGPGALPLALASSLVAPVFAWLVLGNPVHAHDAIRPVVDISPWGLRCLVIAGIAGTIVLAGFGVALRRAVPVSSGLRATALGAAAGAWAGLAVFVFCPSGEIPHLAVGHVLPVAAFTLLGAVLLPRVLRP